MVMWMWWEFDRHGIGAIIHNIRQTRRASDVCQALFIELVVDADFLLASLWTGL